MNCISLKIHLKNFRASIRKVVDKQDQKLRARGKRGGWMVSNTLSFKFLSTSWDHSLCLFRGI